MKFSFCFALSLGLCATFAPAAPVMTDITAGLKLVDEIDTAKVAPNYESSPGISKVETVAGRPARVMVPGEKASAFAYVVGKGKGLKAGTSYVLSIEYPDDVSRTMYIVNRGADFTRGMSTGKANGDVKAQFTDPALESLNFPLSGEWKSFKQFFTLLNRFQGIQSVRDPEPGCRPNLPEDGFNVVITQAKKVNDPRSEGAAVGKIRLYEVSDPSKLYAKINYPPADLPRRHIFWREEMADQIIQTPIAEDQAVDDSADWYVHKMKMAKVLGINTLGKDLLEFGFNQGWETGDQNWTLEAQEPNRDLWTRIVQRAKDEGFDLMPYYEYKTGIGAAEDSLAKQRRAHKLYHGIKKTNGNDAMYTGVWWTEGHNGDLTDPDTLEDAKRMLDQTVVRFKDDAKFAGVWFRLRQSSLPMSFAPTTIARFQEDNKDDEQAKNATQQTLIASYEGDKALYNKYVDWWFGKRVQFLTALRDHLREHLDQKDIQVLMTPDAGEPTPSPRGRGLYYQGAGVITDDPEWWKAYASSMPEGWWKYQWMPTPYSQVVSEDLYRYVLEDRPPINHPMNPQFTEEFHAIPPADPKNYKDVEDVMMTFPIGRLFTVANPQLLEDFRAKSGLTVVKHYTLNEDNKDPASDPSPFDHLLGYISVDCDRAGDHLMLQQARAVANGDPRNIAYLAGSSFSTGFPEVMRRFDQAFLAVPALPSTRLENAASDPEVIVREIPTNGKGTYYYVVNTSMDKKKAITVNLPKAGKVTNLVTETPEAKNALTMDLDSAELRAYRVD